MLGTGGHFLIQLGLPSIEESASSTGGTWYTDTRCTKEWCQLPLLDCKWQEDRLLISFVHCVSSASRSIWNMVGTQKIVVEVGCVHIGTIFLSFVILTSVLCLLHPLFDDWWRQNPTFQTSEKQRKDSVNLSGNEVVKRSFQECIDLPQSSVPLNTATAVCYYLFPLTHLEQLHTSGQVWNHWVIEYLWQQGSRSRVRLGVLALFQSGWGVL